MTGTLLFSVHVSPGEDFEWEAQTVAYGYADLQENRILVGLKFFNNSLYERTINIYRCRDGGLSIPLGEPTFFPLDSNKKQLPDPEFSLEEIHLAKEMINGE
jgi:hypothetical protein